jgi:hypothetical protein
MNTERFDNLSRIMAAGPSRRSLFRWTVGTGLAALAGDLLRNGISQSRAADPNKCEYLSMLNCISDSYDATSPAKCLLAAIPTEWPPNPKKAGVKILTCLLSMQYIQSQLEAKCRSKGCPQGRECIFDDSGDDPAHGLCCAHNSTAWGGVCTCPPTRCRFPEALNPVTCQCECDLTIVCAPGFAIDPVQCGCRLACPSSGVCPDPCDECRAPRICRRKEGKESYHGCGVTWEDGWCCKPEEICCWVGPPFPPGKGYVCCDPRTDGNGCRYCQ